VPGKPNDGFAISGERKVSLEKKPILRARDISYSIVGTKTGYPRSDSPSDSRPFSAYPEESFKSRIGGTRGRERSRKMQRKGIVGPNLERKPSMDKDGFYPVAKGTLQSSTFGFRKGNSCGLLFWRRTFTCLECF